MKDILRELLQKRLLKPIEFTFWLFIIGTIFLGTLVSLAPYQRWLLYGIGLFAALFVVVFFHWVVPHYGGSRWVDNLGAFITILLIGTVSYFVEPKTIHVEVLYLVVVISMGMLSGRHMAFRTAITAAIIEGAVTLVSYPFSMGAVVTLGLQVVTLMLAGYLASVLTGMVRDNYVFSNRQNQYLAILLEVGLVASRQESLEQSLPLIAEMITRDLPVTACCICLLSPNAEYLIVYGASPIRTLTRWKKGVATEYRLKDHSVLQEAVGMRDYLILQENEIYTRLTPQQIAELFFDGVKTIGLFPMIVKGKRLGLVAVAEVRHWEREPIDKEKVGLLQTLATQIATYIENGRLFHNAHNQAQRLQVLNEVARAIGSTIEMGKLLELIYEQVSKVIQTDTYFVALFHPEENTLEFRILIDKGQRFPATSVSADQGLASWVCKSQQPLLIRYLSAERELLPVNPITLGDDEISESWLGLPLSVSDHTLGILAIASYTPNAFTPDDQMLLSNLAAQAALALDNARQHAAVIEQARRDSLTGAYNHGYLLERLESAVQAGQVQNTPVSLIMMDIDYFKNYNDQYGHVLGDQVLYQLVAVTQSHVDKDDIVGRWGGEEFAVALPETPKERAVEVAYDIRSSLEQIELWDKKGRRIPSPTISQGIATLPGDAEDAASLVDIADEALYQAKMAGRNLVVVAGGGN